MAAAIKILASVASDMADLSWDSPKRTVIAPRDADSFSLSIKDITTIEAARIAIALAILRKDLLALVYCLLRLIYSLILLNLVVKR